MDIQEPRQAWPHDACDRVHQLMGELAEKELERMRLHEVLRLIITCEIGINQLKSNRSLAAGQKSKSIARAVEEKNRAFEHARALLR